MNDPLPQYVRDLQERLLVSERERKALLVSLEAATRLAIYYSGRGGKQPSQQGRGAF